MAMLQMVYATFTRCKVGIQRAQPWSFYISRVTTGVATIAVSYFIYHYFLDGSVTGEFVAYAGNADYMTYVVIGAALSTLSGATFMNVGRALITELREGTIETLILSPASRVGYFTGVFCEQLLRSYLEFATVLLFGALIGADIWRAFTPGGLLVVLLALASFFCLGVFLSSVMLYTRDTYITQSTLMYTMVLLCGISFPTEYLPRWAQVLAQGFPLTPTIKLLRQTVMNRVPLAQNGVLVLHVAVLSALYFAVGLFWYRIIEKH